MYKIYMLIENDEGEPEGVIVLGENIDKVKMQMMYNVIFKFIRDEALGISGRA